MATDIRLKEGLPAITEQLVETYTECSRLNHLGHEPLPSRDAVADIVADLLRGALPRLRPAAEPAHRQHRVPRRRPGRWAARQADAADRPGACATKRVPSECQRTHVDCEKRSPSRRRSSCSDGCPRCARCSSRTCEAALRRRPGGEEPPRNHLLLSRASKRSRSIASPTNCTLGVPFIPRMMTEARPRQDRHRHSPRRHDRARLLHRSRHRRGDRRDVRHRRRREALPGRDARGAELPARRGGQCDPRQQAAPDARGRRGGLRERHDPRRRDGDRPARGDRLERLADAFGRAKHSRRHGGAVAKDPPRTSRRG